MPKSRRCLQVGQAAYSKGKNIPCLLTLILVSPQCSIGLSHRDMDLKAVLSFPRLPLKPHLIRKVSHRHTGTVLRPRGVESSSFTPLSFLEHLDLLPCPESSFRDRESPGWWPTLAVWFPRGILKNLEPGDLLNSSPPFPLTVRQLTWLSGSVLQTPAFLQFKYSKARNIWLSH